MDIIEYEMNSTVSMLYISICTYLFMNPPVKYVHVYRFLHLYSTSKHQGGWKYLPLLFAVLSSSETDCTAIKGLRLFSTTTISGCFLYKLICLFRDSVAE